MMPKVLLPILDRPLIQYAVDEALEAGIESLVFVTGRGHAAIEDYFDRNYELEREMIDRGKHDIAARLHEMRPEPGQFVFVRQIEPLGLGHAVWCARNLVGNEPFAVLLADEYLMCDHSPLGHMSDIHDRHGGNVILVDEVDAAKTDRYGVIEPRTESADVIEVSDLIEKPAPEDAPSNLAIIGRYILQPSVMDALGSVEPGAGGEIQLTDAIRASLENTELRAVRSDARRFDCGSPGGFLEATAQAAMANAELADRMLDIARDIVETAES